MHSLLVRSICPTCWNACGRNFCRQQLRTSQWKVSFRFCGWPQTNGHPRGLRSFESMEGTSCSERQWLLRSIWSVLPEVRPIGLASRLISRGGSMPWRILKFTNFLWTQAGVMIGCRIASLPGGRPKLALLLQWLVIHRSLSMLCPLRQGWCLCQTQQRLGLCQMLRLQKSQGLVPPMPREMQSQSQGLVTLIKPQGLGLVPMMTKPQGTMAMLQWLCSLVLFKMKAMTWRSRRQSRYCRNHWHNHAWFVIMRCRSQSKIWQPCNVGTSCTLVVWLSIWQCRGSLLMSAVRFGATSQLPGCWSHFKFLSPEMQSQSQGLVPLSKPERNESQAHLDGFSLTTAWQVQWIGFRRHVGKVPTWLDCCQLQLNVGLIKRFKVICEKKRRAAWCAAWFIMDLSQWSSCLDG